MLVFFQEWRLNPLKSEDRGTIGSLSIHVLVELAVFLKERKSLELVLLYIRGISREIPMCPDYKSEAC